MNNLAIRILAIDDEPFMLKLLGRMLVNLGCAVVILCDNGTDALELVESRVDCDFVCQSGCSIAQGYFIAKPMPAADLPAWMQFWQKARPAFHGHV